jgi:hypothetical protein
MRPEWCCEPVPRATGSFFIAHFPLIQCWLRRAAFRGIPFDSGLSIEDLERASQVWIAHDRFAALGALVNAVTQLAVRVAMSDLEVVTA